MESGKMESGEVGIGEAGWFLILSEAKDLLSGLSSPAA